MGWQVTDVRFSTVDNYLLDSITAHYSALCKADLGLEEVTWSKNDKEATVSDAKAGRYSDDQTVGKVVKKQLEESYKALDGLSSKATVKEKLAKADELIESANKAIDESYASVLSSKKALALKDFEKGVNTFVKKTGVKDFYGDEEKASLLADGKAALNAATTLQGLNEVYADEYNDEAGKKAKGSYVTLLADQEECLAAFSTALDSVDASLKAPKTSQQAYLQASLVSILESYGVTVDKLPSSIADEYASKVMSSRSLEKAKEKTSTYSVGDIILKVDGAKAISNASKSVKTALYNGIVEAYNSEVDALTKASASTKTVLKAAIDKAASDWNASKTTNGVDSILAMLGYDVDSTGYAYTFKDYDGKWNSTSHNTNTDKASLIWTLENVLATNAAVTGEIKSERLGNVLASYKTKWTAELAEVLAGDEQYAEFMAYTKQDSGKYKLDNANLLTLATGVTVENFAFTDRTNEQDTEVAKAEHYNALGNQTQYDYYSAKAVFEALVNAESGTTAISIKSIQDGKAGSGQSAIDTALKAKSWAVGVDGSIKKGYKKFLAKYQSEIAGKLTYSADSMSGTTTTFISADTIKDAFDDNTLDDFSRVAVDTEELGELGQKAYDSLSVVHTLDKGLREYVNLKIGDADDAEDANVIADKKFDGDYIRAKVGVFYKEFFGNGGVLSKIVSGEYSDSDVQSLVSYASLEEIYVKDTKDYGAKTLERLETAVSNIITKDSTLTLNQITAMKNRLAQVEAIVDLEAGEFTYSAALTGEIKKDSSAWEGITSAHTSTKSNVLMTILGMDAYYVTSTELTIADLGDFYTAALLYVQFGFAA